MPAVSKSQQRLFLIALNVKKGKLSLSELNPSLRQKVQQILKNMSERQIEEFTKMRK